MQPDSVKESIDNKRTFPLFSRINHFISEVITGLSALEKAVIAILSSLLLIGLAGMLWQINASMLDTIPHRSGVLNEGSVGSIGPINPLLSVTQTDRDLAKLIYSGLMTFSSTGELTFDLAENYTLSEDNREYIFTLREDVYFHDGEPVKASDVVFTINLAKDPRLQSPHQPRWTGVKSEVLDSRRLKIVLPEPRVNFLTDSTLGVLPKHIWEQIDINQVYISPYNRHPVGSGPYWVETVISETENGVGSTIYRLRSFSNYHLGQPFIETINFRSYSNEKDALEALRQGEINSLSSPSPAVIREVEQRSDLQLLTSPLSRVFLVYFNQAEQELFMNSAVRQALKTAVNKEGLVDIVLAGYGEPVDVLLPTKLEKLAFGLEKKEDSEERGVDLDIEELSRTESAKAILENDGWERSSPSGFYEKGDQELTFTLTVANVSELIIAAQELSRQWQDLGVRVSLEVINSSDELYQQRIRPRNFEALLHGYSLNRRFDLFPFWHSSTRNDPGLNLALYTNIQSDSLLSDLRQETDNDRRKELYLELKEQFRGDLPALFLYSPSFVYIVPEGLDNIDLGLIINPEDRFSGINKWFLQTDRVWRFFNDK